MTTNKTEAKVKKTETIEELKQGVISFIESKGADAKECYDKMSKKEQGFAIKLFQQMHPGDKIAQFQTFKKSGFTFVYAYVSRDGKVHSKSRFNCGGSPVEDTALKIKDSLKELFFKIGRTV